MLATLFAETQRMARRAFCSIFQPSEIRIEVVSGPHRLGGLVRRRPS